MLEPQVDPKRYVPEEGGVLGVSAYAKVYLARCSETKERVVVKKLTKFPPTGFTNDEYNKMILREKSLLEKAKDSGNPNIVKLLNSFQVKDTIYLVMKYYPTKDLAKYLQAKGGKLPLESALELFRKICLGYQWCVTEEVVHRDLKLENIFMDGDEPVIGDFGSARPISEGNSVLMSQKPFSVYNLSPQQIMGNDYGTDADIWGLGLILYEIIYGEHPFGKKGDVEERILFQNYTFNDSISNTQECKDLINLMLLKEQTKRIKWKDLISHALINIGKKEAPNRISFIRILSIEKLHEHEISIVTRKRLFDIYKSTETLTQAVAALKACQYGISQNLGKNFLPFSTFLIFTYGFLKIGIINLRLILSYARNLDSNSSQFKDFFDRCKALKTKLEELFYSENFLALQKGFPEMTSYFKKKLFSPLTNNIQVDYKYIEEFKDWMIKVSGKFVLDEIWKHRLVLKSPERDELSKCIYDVLEIVEENLVEKIINDRKSEQNIGCDDPSHIFSRYGIRLISDE